MFFFTEILESIKRHRSKTFIAGITISWGLILLILLVSTGQGLHTFIKKMFSDYTIKTIEVYGGQATISDALLSKGETLTFSNQDILSISKAFEEVKNISPVVSLNISKISSYNKETTRFLLQGVNENYFNINTLQLENGRFFNHNDVNERVLIIGKKVAESLFNNSKCIGQVIFIESKGYTIIGVIAEGNLFSNYNNQVFMPFNIATSILDTSYFESFILSISDTSEIQEFQKTLKTYLSKIKGFNINDKQVIFFNSVERQLKTINALFKTINVFLWFISISFLISGMLSIFNVMILIVKDRFGEFGIRKAIGATPNSIQKMVLVESVFITLISGIIGGFIGYILVVLINLYIRIKNTSKLELTLDFNLQIVIIALILLVLAGSIAGIIPARKAANVLPVEALRELNN